MKFTVEMDDIAPIIATASRVIKPKSPWPILTNIKIATNDDRVTFIGSDGDTTFEMDAPASVEIEGATCLPFATFAKFISAAKGASVSVEVTGDEAIIKSGRARIALMCGHVEDYPNYKPAEGEPIGVDPSSFCHALRFCIAAASTEETRYYLCGAAFVESDIEDVTVWGCDGSMMHRATLIGVKSLGGGGIVPTEAATTILGIAEKSEAVKAMICDRGWGVETPRVRLWGKVIDGNYPDMGKIVATLGQPRGIASVERDAIAQGIEVAGCGADADSTKSRALVVNCTPEGPIILRGAKPAGGVRHAGRAEVDAQVTDDLSAAFNSAYIRAALTGLKVDRITISHATLRGDAHTLIIRPAQESGAIDMSATIMGMRMSEEELADV